jgi:hypothetical protein
MGLFSFFKKSAIPNASQERTVEELLQQQLDLVPDHCKAQPPFRRSVEFLAQQEHGLVLQNLIELVEGNGHCFTEQHWIALEQIASRLNLPARARYCRVESWAAKRRRQDKVEQMRRVDGFYHCSHGREGMIYYVQQGRVLELYAEMSGDKQFAFLIHFQEATHWALPVKQVVSLEEKAVIREQLSKWLGKVRADY